MMMKLVNKKLVPVDVEAYRTIDILINPVDVGKAVKSSLVILKVASLGVLMHRLRYSLRILLNPYREEGLHFALVGGEAGGHDASYFLEACKGFARFVAHEWVVVKLLRRGLF